MKKICIILIWGLIMILEALNAQTTLTLDKVVNEWCLHSPTAEKIKLSHENTLLAYENYRKGFLPSVGFSFNPVSFNRSQRLMQNPVDGSYSYVDDYSNTSNAGITVKQKVGIIGGTLSVNSNLSVLTEFSSERNNFSTTPVSVSYSQQLIGGYYVYKKNKALEYARITNAMRQYCSEMANVQSQALNLFMSVVITDITCKLALKNIHISDTLLRASKALVENGRFTEYEYKQAELQAANNEYMYESALKDYQQALRTLWVFLGKEEIASVDVLFPDFSLPLAIDYVEAESYIHQNSPFALSQKSKKLEAEQVLFTAKLSNRFNGNLNLSYGLNQYASRFSDAYRKPDYSQAVMIGFQIPIFQWGIGRNKIRMAENAYRNSMLELEESEAGFSKEVKDKVSAYNSAVKLFFLSEKTYKLSQEQYALLSRKFLLGKASVYEISSVQNELYESMKKYYSSTHNVWSNYFVLRQLALYDFSKKQKLEELY